ncbi:MAG: hypothetical protein OES79_08150 [Planctomycetota bacterium]|nr:hypothetical protein [Planctomycetota bacterium]
MTAESRSRIAIWLGQTLDLAAAIFVTGRLSLMIALSPGDATPIFPPAGIALAALLLVANAI